MEVLRITPRCQFVHMPTRRRSVSTCMIMALQITRMAHPGTLPSPPEAAPSASTAQAVDPLIERCLALGNRRPRIV